MGGCAAGELGSAAKFSRKNADLQDANSATI